MPRRWRRPTTRPHISLNLHISPHISPYLSGGGEDPGPGGVEGAGEMAGFAVAFEAPTGERACHGQNVFKVVMRVQPLPNDSGPDLELTMVIGEREYVADGLYFVDMRSLGPAPTTHNVNVTVVPIFAHCQHTGAAYDHALEMSGCAKSTAPPVAALPLPALRCCPRRLCSTRRPPSLDCN